MISTEYVTGTQPFVVRESIEVPAVLRDALEQYQARCPEHPYAGETE